VTNRTRVIEREFCWNPVETRSVMLSVQGRW